MNKNFSEGFKKRMEDIPRPIVVGEAHMTEEEKREAEETLQKLIEKYKRNPEEKINSRSQTD